jgi:hypothetical protein
VVPVGDVATLTPDRPDLPGGGGSFTLTLTNGETRTIRTNGGVFIAQDIAAAFLLAHGTPVQWTIRHGLYVAIAVDKPYRQARELLDQSLQAEE